MDSIPEQILSFLCLLLIGSCIGSFIGMLMYRLSPNKPSNTFRDIIGVSKCDSCGSKIPWYLNIPIISSLLLRFKSKCCGISIPKEYLFYEVISGIVFALFGYRLLLGDSYLMLGIGLLISTFFLYLSFYDYKYYLVRVDMVSIATVLYLIGLFIYSLLFGYAILIDRVLGAIVGVSYVTILILVTRGKGMGIGDLWILGLIGLIVGLKGVVGVIFISIFIGSIFGIFKVFFVEGKLKGVIVPYVPFLSLGLFIELLFPNWGFNFLFPLL